MTLLLSILVFVNPAMTPGAVRGLPLATICATRWGTDSRHVSAALKARVFAAYGIPAKDRGLYLIDHLVPRELDGADVFENLWAEKRTSAHVKDVQENALHRAVCAPMPIIALAAAQQQMRQWALE